MMHYREVESPAALRDIIQCFWYNRFDFGYQPTSFEIPPDSYAEIIFHFGSACHLATSIGWQPLSSPYLMGLFQQPARLRTKDQFEVIGIRCFSWTVFDLLNLPPSTGNVCLAEHPVAQLQASLTQCLRVGDIAAALAEATHYFGRAHSRVAGESLLNKAGRAMRLAMGTLPVSQVAAAHSTVRTLERNFKQAAGYTVKDVSSLMRFEQVRNCLLLQPETRISSLVTQLRYTDQSHLSREFKRYSGLSPVAFARQALRQGPVSGADDSAPAEQ